MVALCLQCGAPLTLDDLGYSICLNCHWQNLFVYLPDGVQGEQGLYLELSFSDASSEARDRAGRSWRRLRGDGEAWCVLCGETIATGWGQGSPGNPQVHLCDHHVLLRTDQQRG